MMLLIIIKGLWILLIANNCPYTIISGGYNNEQKRTGKTNR